MKNLTVNKPEGSKEYDWVDLTADDVKLGGGYKHLVYKTGSNVRLINNRANALKLLIVNGEEYNLQTGNGEIVVPELRDKNVYVVFNDNFTNFDFAFQNCVNLTSIPEDLFADNSNSTQFIATFNNCTGLTSLPVGLFDNNREIKNLQSIFQDCSGLTGESPYTMIGDKKVHLYERANYPEHFTAAQSNVMMPAFKNCTGLTDYAQIPVGWK